jgi:hypothetical protein
VLERPVCCEGKKAESKTGGVRMEPKRGDPNGKEAEVADTLIAISVVAKRLAKRIRTSNPKNDETGVKNGQDKRV